MKNLESKDLKAELAKQELKPYTSPELKIHGSMADLTQCCSGGPTDGQEGFPPSGTLQ